MAEKPANNPGQPRAGTLEETRAALDRGGFAHGVVLNLFAAGPTADSGRHCRRPTTGRS